MGNQKLAIGVFDSGVGGLSVLNAIHQLIPTENLIYVADTLHTPYGSRSVDFIESRVRTIVDFLLNQSVKLIVIACNTATAAAVHSLREELNIPIVGLEPALKPAIEFSAQQRVGVLATQATLESQKYQTLRTQFVNQAQIIEKASPLFVELVESAPQIQQSQYELVEQELQPFIRAKIDSLVLGCTHFPFLTHVITKILGPDIKLFESGLPVAKEVRRQLTERSLLNPQNGQGNIHYFSSSPEKAQTTFNLLLKKSVKIDPF